MAKKIAVPTITGAEIVEYRRKNRLNQSEFWCPLGVTQSGGSRYENERSVPKPVQALLALAYGPEAQAQALFESLRKRDVVEA